MKTLKFLSLIALVTTLFVMGCKKQESTGTCSDGIKNQDETDIDCGGVCTACKVGAQGKWKSYPVAPILATYADSIIATFNTNFTYSVEQWKGGTKVTLTGTYSQTKSSTGNIYDITVNQTAPTTITAKGIFEVDATNTTMKYEIAQTEPAVAGVTPPTAAKGFGSTSNGAFGDINIQNYTRIN